MKKHGKAVLSLFAVLAGNIGYAAAVVLFAEPSGFLMGGATGIALFLNEVFGLSVSLAVLLLNAVFLVMAWVCLGRQFAIQTLLCSIVLPLALEGMERAAGGIVLTEDPMLSALMGGALIGVSLGLIFRQGTSTGGMDIPPLVLHKYCGVSVSAGVWGFDCLVLLLQAFSATSEEILYSILLVIVYTVVLDQTLLLGSRQIEVKVVTEHSAALRDAIFSGIGRGVTLLHGKTGYQEKETEVVLSVLSPRELPLVKRLILSVDPKAFVIISQVTEVGGEGFSQLEQNP